MLLPNLWWTKIFGKLLFLACDLLIGVLLVELLTHLLKARRAPDEDVRSEAVFYSLFWLFNPIAMNVSTRGNAESVIGSLVMLSLYLVVVKKSIIIGAIVYGLAVHVKIYPIVYCLALFLFVDSWSPNAGSHKGLKWFFKTFFNTKRITFALVTVITLVALTAVFYVRYGWTFLYETYLYHLVRKDNRHNFSVYFYHIYLTGSLPESGVSSSVADIVSKVLIDFGPQLALLLSITAYYYKDITFCVLLQTMTFVAFNKVCTVQYFCWYFSLLPLALPWIRSMSYLMRLLLPALWALGQGLWLWYAYRLEFLAENTFFSIWIAGIGYFIINVIIIISLVINHSVEKVPETGGTTLLAQERRRAKVKAE